MTARYVVGYDIGGTKLGIGLSTVEGELIGSERIPNKDTRPEDVLPELPVLPEPPSSDSSRELASEDWPADEDV